MLQKVKICFIGSGAMATAMIAGLLIGRVVFSDQVTAGATLAVASEESAPQVDLAELIRSGQVKGIDVGVSAVEPVGDGELPSHGALLFFVPFVRDGASRDGVLAGDDGVD